MNIKRYLAIYAALWKNSVTREMSFKGNFILWIVVELLWFGLQLCFVSVVFSQTNSVAPEIVAHEEAAAQQVFAHLAACASVRRH